MEFDFVFVSGLEADLFPHIGFGEKKSGEEKEETEKDLVEAGEGEELEVLEESEALADDEDNPTG